VCNSEDLSLPAPRSQVCNSEKRDKKPATESSLAQEERELSTPVSLLEERREDSTVNTRFTVGAHP